MNDTYEVVEALMTVPLTEERPWAAFAVCRDRDPDMFFPLDHEVESEAIRVCQGCPVQADCLEFALETGIRFGVWGSMTEKQRRSLRRQIA